MPRATSMSRIRIGSRYSMRRATFYGRSAASPTQSTWRSMRTARSLSPTERLIGSRSSTRTAPSLLNGAPGASSPGQFAYPGAVAVDGEGNTYVLDFDNERVQKFRLLPPLAPEGAGTPTP